ncbi:hypothetical protein MPER_09969 [Moniliophthora perniciosa FA553]|nr:hypothetical protein MPER_09969 [Moniliophthora perniciosa FA553]
MAPYQLSKDYFLVEIDPDQVLALPAYVLIKVTKIEEKVSILVTSGSGSTKGNSLMNLLRSNTLDTHVSSVGLGNSTTPSLPVPIPSPGQSHFHPHTTNADLRQRHLSQLDRKIIDNPNTLDRDDDLATPIFRTPVNVFDGNIKDEDHASSRVARALTMDAISLQPPPRKRWTSYGTQHPFATADTTTTSSLDDRNESHSLTDRLSVHDQAQAQSTSTTSGLSISPGGMSGFSFGTPEQRPRSPVGEWQSGESEWGGSEHKYEEKLGPQAMVTPIASKTDATKWSATCSAQRRNIIQQCVHKNTSICDRGWISQIPSSKYTIILETDVDFISFQHQ